METPSLVLSTEQELELKRLRLLEEIGTIRLHLGDKNLKDEYGRRMPAREHKRWRQRACKALLHKEQEYRQVRDNLRALQRRSRLRQASCLLNDVYAAAVPSEAGEVSLARHAQLVKEIEVFLKKT